MSMTVTTVSQLSRHKPNANDDFLIGAGFLCRGGSTLVTGGPGGGKSKWVQHLMFSIALGRSFLGFRPARAFRVLYIQNEDTMDDMHESLMGFVEQHGLGKAEINMIDKQCVLIHASGVSGEDFVSEVRQAIETHKPDIVITDPLLAFIGCDLIDQTGVTNFLRNGMAPVMQKNRCGWICIHHSSKGAIGKFGGSTVVKGLGSIEIAAFFRGIIDLERKPADPSLSVLEVAKRAKQAGLRSPDGQPIHRMTVRAGQDIISWTVDASVSSTPAAPKPAGRPAKTKKDEVAAFVAEQRALGSGVMALTKAVADKFGYSTKQARRYATA